MLAEKQKLHSKWVQEKTAIIDAHSIYEKPYGCEYVKLGSTPIGGVPIKVELNYVQNETHWIKRATLPGIKIKGGLETEQYVMFHNAVIYHYPSASNLKKGYLVMAENTDPEPGSKTEYVLETGYYDFTKKWKMLKLWAWPAILKWFKTWKKAHSTRLKVLRALPITLK